MPATVVTRAIGETTPPTRSESLFCDVYEPRTGKVVPANLCSTARPPQAENCGDSHPRRFAERESPYPHFRAKIVSRHPLAKRAQAVLSEPKRAQADDFTFWSSNPPPIEGNTPDLPEKNRNPLRCWTSTTCINSSAFMRAKPPDPVALTAPCLQVAVALERVARRTSAVARDCPDASHISRSAGLHPAVSPTCSRQGDRRPGNSTHSTGLSFQIKNTSHTAPSSHPRLDIRCPCHFRYGSVLDIVISCRSARGKGDDADSNLARFSSSQPNGLSHGFSGH
jgi:hypothetical protein